MGMGVDGGCTVVPDELCVRMESIRFAVGPIVIVMGSWLEAGPMSIPGMDCARAEAASAAEKSKIRSCIQSSTNHQAGKTGAAKLYRKRGLANDCGTDQMRKTGWRGGVGGAMARSATRLTVRRGASSRSVTRLLAASASGAACTRVCSAGCVACAQHRADVAVTTEWLQQGAQSAAGALTGCTCPDADIVMMRSA